MGTSPEAVRILLAVIVIGGIPWFWLHCAAPALSQQRAPRAARRVAAAASVAGAAGSAFTIAFLLLHRPSLAFWVWMASGTLWLLVVGVGYPRYRWLIRLTDRRQG